MWGEAQGDCCCCKLPSKGHAKGQAVVQEQHRKTCTMQSPHWSTLMWVWKCVQEKERLVNFIYLCHPAPTYMHRCCVEMLFAWKKLLLSLNSGCFTVIAMAAVIFYAVQKNMNSTWMYVKLMQPQPSRVCSSSWSPVLSSQIFLSWECYQFSCKDYAEIQMTFSWLKLLLYIIKPSPPRKESTVFFFFSFGSFFPPAEVISLTSYLC